jgi:hypothetical protein
LCYYSVRMFTVGSGTAGTGVNWSKFPCWPAQRSNACPAGNLWYMGTRTGGAMTEEHLTGVTPGEYKFTVRLPVEMRDRLRKMAELSLHLLYFVEGKVGQNWASTFCLLCRGKSSAEVGPHLFSTLSRERWCGGGSPPFLYFVEGKVVRRRVSTFSSLCRGKSRAELGFHSFSTLSKRRVGLKMLNQRKYCDLTWRLPIVMVRNFSARSQ